MKSFLVRLNDIDDRPDDIAAEPIVIAIVEDRPQAAMRQVAEFCLN